MAISKQAEAVKQEMLQAVTLRRELEAVECEWQDLLAVLEEAVGEAAAESFAVATAVHTERMALRRRLTEAQLSNWARICAGGLTPLQRRILGLRFVRGCTWSDLTEQVGKAKQYLLREHNKALEAIAKKLPKCLEGDKVGCGKMRAFAGEATVPTE